MGRSWVASEWQARSGWLALAAALCLPAASAAQEAAPGVAPPADVAPEPQAAPEPPRDVVVITPPEVPYTRARVVHEPSNAEIGDLYPEGARQRNVGGRARVLCEIAATQRLVNCVVTHEDPPGYGFGAALLKVAELYRVAPPTYDGDVVRDAKFAIPMRFVMEPAAPAPPTARPPRRSLETEAARVAPEETRAERLRRLGPLKRSDSVLWAPIGFALAVGLGLVWGLWPVRRGRRVRRPADQRA